MKDFKFLTNNDTLSLNGQMSFEVIQYFNDYVNRIIRYEITTNVATYKMVDYTYGNGQVVAGTVHAYPIESPNVRVVYHIRNNEITSFTMEFDYFITMSHLANAIRRED